MRQIFLLILPLILAFTVGANPLEGRFNVVAIQAQVPLNVVATTTILADVAQNIAGGLFTVRTLIPADTDPHAFEPSTETAALIANADLVLAVGAGYEAFLADLLVTVGENIPTVFVSTGIEILPYGEHAHEDEGGATDEPDDEHLGVLGDTVECAAHEHHDEDEVEGEEESGVCDPHVWQDVANVILWANNLADTFTALDPSNTEVYRANADAYIDQLAALDAEIREMVSTIPEDRRVLVTNHDFMGYFAHAYAFEIAATVLPGSATGSEIAPQELAALIELVQTEGVPAIFAENTTNPQFADLIAQEAGISVVTTLYSDALGGAESGAETYIDMMRFNTQTIVEALGD